MYCSTDIHLQHVLRVLLDVCIRHLQPMYCRRGTYCLCPFFPSQLHDYHWHLEKIGGEAARVAAAGVLKARHGLQAALEHAAQVAAAEAEEEEEAVWGKCGDRAPRKRRKAATEAECWPVARWQAAQEG
jgi:hypothetical protein